MLNKEENYNRYCDKQYKVICLLQNGENGEKNEIYDQTNKVSFITQAPPPSLDTYVNVEGYQNTGKKKMAKQNSSQNIMSEDILKGVVFPRSSSTAINAEIQVEDRVSEENGTQDTTEKLSIERTRFHWLILYHNHFNSPSLVVQWMCNEILSSSQLSSNKK